MQSNKRQIKSLLKFLFLLGQKAINNEMEMAKKVPISIDTVFES
jgi:hypothetical protein